MAAGEPCNTKRIGTLGKWIFFVLGALITAVLSVPRFGTVDYVVGMLSRWWV
jgi:hypothetical protein